jgi:N utilization substance protein B
MLYRRNARIKVMQALYGYLQDEQIPKDVLGKQLQTRFNETYQAYLLCLLTIKDVCEFAEKYADIVASKLLASEEDKQVSTRLANSVFVTFLDEQDTIRKKVKEYKLTNLLDEELTRKFFYDLKERPLYQKYVSNGPEQAVSDVEIIQFLLGLLSAAFV